MALDLTSFDDLIDTDFLASMTGNGPATASLQSSGRLPAALAYAVGHGDNGTTALELVHSIDAIVGRQVDFTG